MSERKGVEIDYCPQCRGVWLDRGELDKIIEKSVSEEQTTSHSYRDKHYDRQGYDKPYRKKSFWHELFD